jgi:hypothetical protein
MTALLQDEMELFKYFGGNHSFRRRLMDRVFGLSCGMAGERVWKR